MKMVRFTLSVFFLFVLFLSPAFSQNWTYNQWLDHLPYNNCKVVAEANTMIYAATPYSLMYFDKSDNSLSRLNKVTGGLSDIGISNIAYCSKLNTIVVAYSNTNIDLVKGSDVINVPDIKRKQILGNKTINSILIIDKLAYLGCGFGIVVLDIEKEEIKDTYYIGPSGSQIDVKAITFHAVDNKFYAATEKGIYSALATSNLAFYKNWQIESSIPDPDNNFNLITSFGGKVFANKTKYTWDSDSMYVKNGNTWSYFIPNDHWPRTSMRVCGELLVICSYNFVTTYKPDGSIETVIKTYVPDSTIRPNDALIDKEGKVWIADIEKGLLKEGNESAYVFNGPISRDVYAMDISGKQLWVVSGGRTPGFGYLFHLPQFYTLKDHKWSSYSGGNIPLIEPFRDIMCVAADPNDGNHAFLGSWGYGLLEVENGKLKTIYDTQNSTLQYVVGYDYGNLRVGGLAFDKNKNLWVTNSNAPNVLSMRKPNGEWKSYSLGSQLDVGNLVIDKENQKWIQLRDLALYVFNDNNTPDNIADDRKLKITSAVGNGALPGTTISSMAVDREGQLWLGTDEGVAVIYSPGNVFNGGNFDAQVVKVELDQKLYPLLGTEIVTAIAVNGNNEKWFGTDKAGVFLMSADGSKELLHFTEANSPLLSNSIQSIKIASDGEVYFGTSLGIVSYKDYKVEPPATLDSLIVFPNPVRPEYKGPVFISNLVAESNVKITDITGALVFETQALGGRVIWEGNNLEGRRVNTGVYLIFVTNPDGTMKRTAKVLFMR